MTKVFIAGAAALMLVARNRRPVRPASSLMDPGRSSADPIQPREVRTGWGTLHGRRWSEEGVTNLMGTLVQDSGWRLPDELWGRMQPRLPPGPPHPDVASLTFTT